MKKVIILSFYFPPDNAIGGQRPYGFAKHLSDYNWKPIIITANKKNRDYKYDNMEVYKTEYKDLEQKYKKNIDKKIQFDLTNSNNVKMLYNKLLKVYNYFLRFYLYPDKAIGWNEKKILETIDKITKKEKIDYIISTGPPQYTHILAHKIYEKFNIPYVIDFRDLWYLNPYRHHNNIILKFLDKIKERKIINSSKAIITVSNTWEKWLRKRYPNKIITCIRNGYNEEDFKKINLNKKKENDSLVITYAGSLYNGKRNVEPLLKAISNLNKDKVKFVFFGKETGLVKKIAQSYSIDNNLIIKGYKDRSYVIKYLTENTDILLFLNWDNEKEAGTIAGKLYEYFALKKPILGIGYKKGEAAQLIKNYSLGNFYSTKESNKIESFLKEHIEKSNKSNYDTNNKNEYIQRFNRKNQVKKLVNFLESL